MPPNTPINVSSPTEAESSKIHELTSLIGNEHIDIQEKGDIISPAKATSSNIALYRAFAVLAKSVYNPIVKNALEAPSTELRVQRASGSDATQWNGLRLLRHGGHAIPHQWGFAREQRKELDMFGACAYACEGLRTSALMISFCGLQLTKKWFDHDEVQSLKVHGAYRFWLKVE